MKHLKLFEDFKPENLTTLRIEQPNNNDDATFINNKDFIDFIDDIKKLKNNIIEFLKVYSRLYRKNLIISDEELKLIKSLYELKDYYSSNKSLYLKKLLDATEKCISIPIENKKVGEKIDFYHNTVDYNTLKKEFHPQGNGYIEFSWLISIQYDIDDLIYYCKRFINSYDTIYHYQVELTEEEKIEMNKLYEELKNYKKTGIINIKTIKDNVHCFSEINYDITQSYRKVHGIKSRKYIPHKNITNKK